MRGVLPAGAGHPPPPLMDYDDLSKVCRIAVKTKQQLDSAQIEIKKLTKVLNSSKRREKSIHADIAAPVSSLTNSWANLLLQLSSQSSAQLKEMRTTIAAKDSQLMSQKREIERLNTKVATLTHDNNLAHLSLQ